MNPYKTSLIQLHSSIIIFGGTGLFAQLINLPAIDITIWRSLIAAMALLLLFIARGRSLKLQTQSHFLLMLACGALMGLHWASYFQSMQMAGVAVGMAAVFTHPLMTVLLEPFFKGRRPQLVDIGCGALMLVGVLLLVPEFSLGNTTTQGICWALLAAFLVAVRNVLQGHYLYHYRGDHSIFYQALVAGLVCLPMISTNPATISGKDLLQLLLLGIVFTALPHSFYTNSLRYLAAKSAALIGCLQPVYGTVLAVLILSEQPTATTLLGGAIIISTSAIESYRSRKGDQQALLARHQKV